MYSERYTRRERGRQGDMVTDTGTREPSAVGLSCHPRNVGKGGDTIGRWQHLFPLTIGSLMCILNPFYIAGVQISVNITPQPIHQRPLCFREGLRASPAMTAVQILNSLLQWSLPVSVTADIKLSYSSFTH